MSLILGSREKKTGNVSEDRNQTYKQASLYLIMLPNFPQIIQSVIIIKTWISNLVGMTPVRNIGPTTGTDLRF